MNIVLRIETIAQRACDEKLRQLPDYEYLGIKHNRKIRLLALKKLAKSLDSLYINLSGERLWGK